MQDAVEQISEIISCFPKIYKIGIIHKNNIIVYYSDTDFREKSFTNTVELLKWCEENLQRK